MYKQSMQVAKQVELVLANTTASEILAENITDNVIYCATAFYLDAAHHGNH